MPALRDLLLLFGLPEERGDQSPATHQEAEEVLEELAPGVMEINFTPFSEEVN